MAPKSTAMAVFPHSLKAKKVGMWRECGGKGGNGRCSNEPLPANYHNWTFQIMTTLALLLSLVVTPHQSNVASTDTVEVNRTTALYQQADFNSPQLAVLSHGTLVVIHDRDWNFARVTVVRSGVTGYIMRRALDDGTTNDPLLTSRGQLTPEAVAQRTMRAQEQQVRELSGIKTALYGMLTLQVIGVAAVLILSTQ